ncbi:MAG: SdrD B-like domain-containing protein, partial [Anaerolineae bacterium]|nr:SdrD B-like domain-containing protein [Anaerolineae bacterium]
MASKYAHSFSRSALSLLTALALMLSSLLVPSAATPALATGAERTALESQAPTAISGVVFRDFNANGTQDTNEPGVPGVTVTAYPASDTGTTGGVSATTSGTGAFSLGTGAGQWRIEVTGYPSYLFPGAAGNTTVVFASDGASGLQIGLNNPGQYAPSSGVQMAFVEHSSGIRYFGIGMSPVNDPVVVRLPESAGASSTNPADYETPAKTTIVRHSDVGAVWGMARDRERNALYVASFIRRFVPLKGNPTTIYRISLATNTASAWFTVDPARTDPHGSSPNWTQDFGVIPWAIKEGLGDLTISDDGKTLYAVDLGIRRLLQIPILSNGNPGTMVAVSLVSGTGNPYSLIQSSCPEMGDFRAFGLGYRDGRVYLGAVCTGESTVPSTSLPFDIDQKGPRPGDHSRLRGYVFEYDGSTWTVKLNFPLTYERGWVNWGRSGWYSDTTYARGSAKWSPWAPKYPCTGNNDYCWYPQPVISEIDFDNDGDMIIGMMDRFALMDAYNAARPSGGVTLTPTAVGDVLRACRTGERTWVMESLVVSGSGCNPPATRTRNHKIYHPTNTDYRAPIQEHYYQDDVKSDQADDGSVNNSPPGHSEIASGALLQIPGRSFVVSTVIDPGYHLDYPWEQSGLHWMTNSSGAFLRGYVARDEQMDGRWSKAGGLGDVEPLLDPAPLELGNRLWCDTGAGSNQVGAGNGVQDPGEPIISSATVQLQCDTDGNPGNGYEASATATTDSQGRYLFRDNTGGITAANGWPAATWNSSVRIIPRSAQCRLLINPNQSAVQQACGSGSLPTIPNNGGSDSGADLRDSDGTPNVDGAGNTGVVFTTGGHGNNNHAWDFGFRPLDFGDAPDTGPGTGVGNYNTTAADNGPSHVILPNLRLGQTAPDADPGTLQNTAADADDTTGADDEDGVPTLPTVTTASTSVPLTVQVFNNRATGATVACWMDFNRDGDFLDAGEGASAAVSSSSSLQTINLTFTGFAPPVAGVSYLRCRVASAASEVAAPIGPANTGEVEDY